MASSGGRRVLLTTRTPHNTPRHTFYISIQQHVSRRASGKRECLKGGTLYLRQCRYLSSTPIRNAGSPLFQLGALSNSRESQWFRKASGLGQIEFSPQLQLIRSSEVLPQQGKEQNKFENTMDSTQTAENAAETAAPITQPLDAVDTTVPQISDVEALALGRQLLTSHRQAITRLEGLIDMQKQLLADVQANHAKERQAWNAERRTLEKDQRSAATILIATVAVATLLTTWTYFPTERAPWTGPKNPFGEQFPTAASRSRQPERTVKAVEPVEGFSPSAGVPLSLASESMTVPAGHTETLRTMPAVKQAETQPKRSWSSLFWS